MKLAWVLCLCVLLCCAFLLAPVSAGPSCSGAREGKCGVGSFAKEDTEVEDTAAAEREAAAKEAAAAKAKAAAKARARAKAVYQALVVTKKSCDYINLRAPWGMSCPKYSWFNCASTGAIKGYRVKVVPAQLVLFHGSTTLPETTLAPGLAYYSGYLTAQRYRDRSGWDSGRYPKIHSYRTTEQFPVVDLMHAENQQKMNDVLVAGLHGKADRKGMSAAYPLQSITGWPGTLQRTSVRDTDRLAFEILCEDWTPKGIWGFAGYYKVGEFHPELVLCKSEGRVMPSPDFRVGDWTAGELQHLPGREIPNWERIC